VTQGKLPWKSAQQARSRETVAAILTATDLLLREGVLREKLSLRDVAKRAGVSPGTFYHYFPDRDALLRALEEASWLEVATEVARTIQDLPGDDPAMDTRVVVAAVVGAIVPRIQRHGFVVRDPATLEMRLARIERVVDMVAAVLEEDRARFRLDDIRFSLRLAIKAVFLLTWVGVEQHPAEIESRAFQEALGVMVSAFLFRD
jgi:AcrR family transcriptional regulator